MPYLKARKIVTIVVRGRAPTSLRIYVKRDKLEESRRVEINRGYRSPKKENRSLPEEANRILHFASKEFFKHSRQISIKKEGN